MQKFFKNFVAQIFHSSTAKQFNCFIVIGIISTIISYSTFIFCLRVLGVNYIASNIIAFFFGVFFGYNCNKRWTFKQAKAQKFHLPQYLAVYTFSLFIGTIFLKITVDYFGITPELAFIASIGITTCTNFLGTKFLVFKN